MVAAVTETSSYPRTAARARVSGQLVGERIAGAEPLHVAFGRALAV